MTTQINSLDFNEKVKQSKVPTLVDFWAPWCGPCRILGPIVDEISQSIDKEANVYKVNVDENPDLADYFGIRSIPTVLVFKNGTVSDTLVGVQNKQKYVDALQN
ncbi:MAG: thioredoxin [Deltaproteobacteria bacterium]|jgi:thioredoxin 1|nr:thioredoxin [Deltaproteobacteria bacterium]MBT4525251.1 thioredoxin [Deltaproteobacteria bacterium]